MTKKKAEPTQSPANSTHTDYIPQQPALFDDLPLPPPQMPSKYTRCYRLLSEMQKGNSLTHPQWYERGNGWRLAADIQALEYLGWEVISERIKQDGMSIARYRLSSASLECLRGANHA